MAENDRRKDEEIRVGRQLVHITRSEKALFPRDGIANLDLVEYYQRIAPVILPYLRDRPLVMERYPDGIDGESFFQKQAGRYFPSWIKTVSVPKQGGTVDHVICNDAATLIYLAGQAVITPHIWLSCAKQLNNPDLMVFDLDPSQDEFPRVATAALELRKLLTSEGLEPFVSTTGSRGLHVMVRLDRRRDFDSVRAYARSLAERLAAQSPEHLTTAIQKKERHGRIFIDTGRDAYAQTIAAPYAVRAKDGAPVATPLRWEELEDQKMSAGRFNIRSIFERLDKVGDPLAALAQRRKHAA